MKDRHAFLAEGLARLGLSPAEQQIRQLLQFEDLLLEKNRQMNLTAITDPEDVITLHFLDSAQILTFPGLASAGSLVDIGTGAGFPGLVCKILCPPLRVTLIDSLDKRIRWLTEVAGALQLEGLTCLHARAEELARDSGYRESFDFAASRAVAELRILDELCLPFVRVGGTALFLKSTASGAESDAAARGITLLGGRLLPAADYTIPFTQVTHRIIPVEKVHSTPERYPRRFSRIKQQPL